MQAKAEARSRLGTVAAYWVALGPGDPLSLRTAWTGPPGVPSPSAMDRLEVNVGHGNVIWDRDLPDALARRVPGLHNSPRRSPR